MLLVDGQDVVSVGSADDVARPEGAPRVDVWGTSIMPAIVNAHAHLPSDRAERTALLLRMAYSGTGVVVAKISFAPVFFIRTTSLSKLAA